MKFPNSLLQKSRRTYPSNLILSFNYMFARCPNIDWQEGEEFPDFNAIKLDQSFNWSVFSTPSWARFNDNKEYREGYGVIGIKVDTIRNSGKFNPKFNSSLLNLIHDPLEYNYSHCVLIPPPKNLGKVERRELRMTFKHNCMPSILPLKQRSKVDMCFDYLRMFAHRFALIVTYSIHVIFL